MYSYRSSILVESYMFFFCFLKMQQWNLESEKEFFALDESLSIHFSTASMMDIISLGLFLQFLFSLLRETGFEVEAKFDKIWRGRKSRKWKTMVRSTFKERIRFNFTGNSFRLQTS